MYIYINIYIYIYIEREKGCILHEKVVKAHADIRPP